MKFNERKEWLYDVAVFEDNVKTAMTIQAEYIKKFSARPFPKFMEVDRRESRYDSLWHVPLDDRTAFSRVLEVPALIYSEKPDWRLTKVGIVPQQKYKIWLSNLHLQEADWFPMRGDMLAYNGYRHMIINVVLDPNAFWMQTNVWLGLVLETIIPADGDARPVTSVAQPAPSELTGPPVKLPEYTG